MKPQKPDSYRKTQIETANPATLIIMLFDRAIALLDKAKKEIQEKDYEQKGYSLTKANEIIAELASSLDMEKGGEIATSLKRLYGFVIQQILDADMNLNTNAIDNAKKVVSELRESWASIKDNPDAVPQNSDNTTSNVDLSG
ncbi:MAG: Flagellar secretion chaperone FliS [Candidatus Scalindua arabica]|uniref:Flagellar secretion chaperone FliS n=1 Tax=Candidatus Scalindua arabica TaxID=1127984 RepID=A0A941W0V7_9BACT|nr:Flagellar secretion chaperone FliS [Candidatus Scalindua arabica]